MCVCPKRPEEHPLARHYDLHSIQNIGVIRPVWSGLDQYAVSTNITKHCALLPFTSTQQSYRHL